MDRRAYLTALGAAVAAVSGCSEGDSAATPTSTSTREPTESTPTPASTAEPTSTPAATPRIAEAGLLLDRGLFDTLDDIESVGRGGRLVVGFEYDFPVADGTVNGSVQTTVLDSTGERVATDSDNVNAIVDDGSERERRSAWASFDTGSWELGGYTAEVRIDSENFGTTATTEVAFDIVEPLGEGEAEMYIAEFPDDAVAGEPFDWTLGFRNLTDRDSSVVSGIVTLDSAGAEPVPLDIPYRENVPAGESVTVEEEDIALNRPGTYTYAIARLDAEVSFTISEPE